MSIDTWDVYVTDSGETVVDMLHGVVAIMNSYSLLGLTTTVLTFALLMIAIRFVLTGGWNGALRWFVVSAIVIFGLMTPKKPVLVQDYSDTYFAPVVVEDVPIGLAAALSFSTVVGHQLVKVFETAFGTVDGSTAHNGFQYSVGGMLAGERTLQSLLSADAQDPRIIYNVNQFLKNCVYPKAAQDKDFEQITKNGDLIDLFGNNTSTAMTNYKPASGTADFEQCSIIAPTIATEIETEADNAMRRGGSVNHPNLPIAEAKSAYASELGYVSERYIGLSMDGPELISQVMAINMIKRSLTDSANSGGDAAIMDFVNAQAATQSRMTMASIGGLMKTALPKMHAVLIIVLIGLFPVIIVMSLIPGGGGTIKFYFLFFLNLQAWPILFSVFSRIIQGETIKKANALSKAAAQDAPYNPQLDMTVLDPLAVLPSETSAIALMMIGLIPGIAMMLSKGYSAVAGQLESTLRPISVATENAAASGTTGNISLGNANLQNHSVRTKTQDQINTSGSVNTGLFTQTLGTGARKVTDRHGDHQVFAQPAIGNSALTGRMNEFARQSYNTRLADAESQRQTSQTNYDKSTSVAKNQLMAGALAMREGHSSQDVFGFDMSSSQRDALQKELAAREDYVESMGVGSQESYRAFLSKELQANAGITLGFGKGPVSGSVGLSGVARTGSERNTVESSDNRYAETFGINSGYRDTSDFSNAYSAMSSQKDSLSKDNTNSFTKSLTANMGEAERWGQSYVNANNKIKSLDKAFNIDEGGQVSFDKALDPEMQNYLYNESGYSSGEVDRILSNRGDDQWAMDRQREAYGIVVDRALAANPGAMPMPEGGIALGKQDMSANMPSLSNANLTFQKAGGEARTLGTQSSTDGHIFIGREQLSKSAGSKIYDQGDQIGASVHSTIGSSLAEGGDYKSAVGDHLLANRDADVLRYAEEVKQAYDEAPVETIRSWEGGGNHMRPVTKKVKRPDLSGIEPPISGSLREARENGTVDVSDNNRPVERIVGGQSQGMGLAGRDNLELQPRQRSPLENVKKVVNELDSPAPGMGALDFALASNAVSQEISAIMPQTIGKDTEFGGLVYKTSNGFGATPAREGQINPVTGQRSFDPAQSVQDVPPGALIIGDYHTHGANPNNGVDYNGFSQSDIAAINADRGMPGLDQTGSPYFVGGWLGGTEGQLSFYPADKLPDGASDQAIENATVDLPPVTGNTFERFDEAKDIIAQHKNGGGINSSERLSQTLADADDPATMIAALQNEGVLNDAIQISGYASNTASTGAFMRSLGENSGLLKSTNEAAIAGLEPAEQFNYNLGKAGVEFGSQGFDRSNYTNLGLRSGKTDHDQRTGDAGPFTGQAQTGEVAENLNLAQKAQAFFNQGNSDFKDDRRNPVTFSDTNVGPAWFLGLSDAQKQEQVSLFLEQPIATNYPESYGGDTPTRGAVIKAFSEKENLDPNFVTGIMMAEAWDNSRVEESYENTLASMGRPASIGIAQGHTDTITKGRPMNFDYGVQAGTIWPGGNESIYSGNVDNTTEGAAKMLQSDEYAIAFATGYIRNVADHGGTMDSYNHQYVEAIAQDPPPNGFGSVIDKQMLAGHGSQWDEAHQRLMASEYTSTAFDTDGYLQDNNSHPYIYGWSNLVIPGAEASKATGYFGNP
ncbi:MAG: conjugal transfer protein TraG N-terminal domain-containing protein [Maricaulaceae bacterium]